MRNAFHGRLPAPATLIAVVALVFAAGGLAAGAIPSNDGTIHSCYSKHGGQLRIVRSAKCRHGEKPLSWSQHGPQSVTVRAGAVRIHFSSCFMVGTGSSYTCSGSGSATVRCLAGERATGGGYGTSSGGSSVSPTASYPAPTSGTPTGWTVSAAGFTTGSTTNPPDATLPIYAVCET